MTAIDHRAEAERILRETGAGSTSASLAEYTAALKRAQVHATLADAPVAAGVEAKARDLESDLRLLREAARAVCRSAGQLGPRTEVDGPALGKLWTLVAEVSS